jgi:hypothetical protein
MKNNYSVLSKLIWVLLVICLVFLPMISGQASAQPSDFRIYLDIRESNENTIEFELSSIGDVYFHSGDNGGFDQIGDYVLHGEGQPELPFFSRLIKIPDDIIFKQTLLDDQIQNIDPPQDLKWIGKTIPIEEDFMPGEYQVLSTGVFSGTKIIPEQPIFVSDSWIQGQRYLKLEVYPFQFDQKNQNMIWHEKLVGRILLNLSQADYVDVSGTRNVEGASEVISQALSVQPGTQKVKIVTDDDSVYKITASELNNLGLINLNPNLFKMTSQGKEIAFHLINENGNNVFDGDEAVVFWGERFDGEYLASLYASENQNWFTFSRQLSDGTYDTWKPAFNKIMLEKYTNENVYWLSWNEGAGTRMQSVPGEPQGGIPEIYFRTSIKVEENRVWRTFPFNSEETWYWERIQGDTDIIKKYPIQVDFPHLDNNQAILRGSILAAKTYESTSPDHHVKVFINDQTTFYGDFTWDGKSRLNFEFSFPMSYLFHGISQIKLEVIPTANVPQEDLFVDWFEIEYDRDYQTQTTGNNLIINPQAVPNQEFLIKGFSSSDIFILDIQNPHEPVIVTGWEVQHSANNQSYEIRFMGDSGNYALSETTNFKNPKAISFYTTPDYLGGKFIDYTFIASPELFAATTQLATYRAKSGYNTTVVDFSNLVDDFNFGISHPIAIKNYFRYLLQNQGRLPGYALLVGDGHWNFLRSPNYSYSTIHIPPNLSWVDPWQGEVDSANLLATIIGDDPIADLVIARLPVNTEDEVLGYLSKLKKFDQAKPQSWHNKHLFIADNPDDAGDFYQFADKMIASYVSPEPGMVADRIYLDNDPDKTSQEIIDYFNNQGSQIVNYIGHGSINGWTAEGIFQTGDVNRLINSEWNPLIISMTCLDGYWIHPNQASLIEELIRSPYGSIAAFSPTGLGVSTGHDVMHQALYHTILIDKVQTLGQAVEAAKLALYNSHSDYDLLHTFTIFGDPALTFNFDWVIYIPGVLKGH